jgi:tRNA A-37 threonylcarbamoyl transferase component Bud32
MVHTWRASRNTLLALVLVTPLAWLLCLRLVPEANVHLSAGRFYELAGWVNVALIPLLGFLALAAHLATGNRLTLALAAAAFTFATVFPLHQLFDAQENLRTLQLFGPPARFFSVVVFLALSQRLPAASLPTRRRQVILIVAILAALTPLRFLLRKILNDWAEGLVWLDQGLEPLTVFLALLVALRLFTEERYPPDQATRVLAWTFVLNAEQTLFFFFSQPVDFVWLTANVLWGVTTALQLWAVFVIMAESGRSRSARPTADEPSALWSAQAGLVILKQLGEGGMGKVYQARHRLLNRVVAVKVIRPEQLANPAALRRFQREGLASARLSHPNIVQIHDAGEADGTHYLVMEYVEGTDLAELIQRRGPLPIGLACEYARQASLGLQHAHEKGLVHRDIKPANLLVTSDGSQVKILDMGVARFLQGEEQAAALQELTQTGAVMGTPAYLAPEQARDSRRADIRSDIYSLGCTLYQLLSGQVPFRGVSLAEIVLMHQLEEPLPIEQIRPDVCPALRAVLRKMMAKSPEDRFQTPAKVAEALAEFARLNRSEVASWRGNARNEQIISDATAAYHNIPPTP